MLAYLYAGIFLLGPTQIDEIRGAEKATRKTYSYTVTESQRLRNKEVRYLSRFYFNSIQTGQ
jgi:hypothetical protein